MMMMMKVFTLHLNLMKKTKNKIDTKPLNAFDYLKSLSQKAKDLMDEIEDADKDIDIYRLAFIGSNMGKFNFNTFKMPLNFHSAISNSEVSLKEAEIKQRELNKKIDELKFSYIPENAEEEK